MMIPMTQGDEVRFVEVAARGAEREVGDGVRLAQACLIEEILGVFLPNSLCEGLSDLELTSRIA